MKDSTKQGDRARHADGRPVDEDYKVVNEPALPLPPAPVDEEARRGPEISRPDKKKGS